jgi:hypothetical protein
MSKRQASDIWKHFIKVTDNVNKAKCTYCGSEISRGGQNAAAKGFTTSNMWAHVKRFHGDEVIKVQYDSSLDNSTTSDTPPIKKQATIPHLLENICGMYDINHPRAKEITQTIAELICLDMEPLDLVNKKGFNRLLRKLCPKYKIVSRTYITETVLPDMYSRVKNKVQIELNKIPYIVITTDLWTSDSSSNINDFISFTAHGINQNFETQNFCLEVMPFEGDSHSGENIAHNLNLAMLKWEINNKVVAVVTDNARNIVNAIKELQSLEHISCMVHTVQLVLHDGLLEQAAVKEVITISRKIIGHFSHSTKAAKMLLEAQTTYNIPKHVLIQDVPTRWDSTYYMLSRLYEQRISVQVVLPKLNCNYELSTQQWILVQKIVDILKYFEDVTKALSNENSLLSDAIPLRNNLMKIMEKISSDNSIHANDHCIKSIAQSLHQQLSARFCSIEENDSYIMATALNPKYKTRVFLSSTTARKAKELLCSTIRKQKDQNVRPLEEEPSTSSTSSRSDDIWSICQEIIDDVQQNEPLSNYIGKEETSTSNINLSSILFS